MRIFRYLTNDVLSHTAAVAFILFLVVFSGRFIKYLAEAAVGDLTADVLLPVMLFKLPSFFELILPLSLFIGILLSLGRLYAESEMVILKACGFGPRRIAAYILVPSTGVMLLVAFLSLQLAPTGSERAQQLLDDPRSADGLQALAAGRFKKQRSGELVTYAETISADGVMSNVFVVERKSEGTGDMVITHAEEGEILFDNQVGRRYLELRHGTRYRGVPGTPNYEAVAFQRYGELIPEREGSLRANIKTDALPTQELINSDNPRHRATLYWRLSLPILVPVMALAAIALSRTDSRRGRYARLGPALLLFMLYFIALTQARSTIEGGGGLLPLLATHAGFALLSLIMLEWESLSKRLRSMARG
jgi:lipopolysaccharide export system permease protein